MVTAAVAAVSTAAATGWTAAFCAVLFNGSFTVPIKSETCKRLDIDPLVFQTYKTIMCLLFSLSAVWIMGVPITFSPWGVVSGLFWIPSGVATVMAVKLLGISLAVAVGNSLMALVSFTWGIFIFQEKVHSKPMACLAVLMMITGFTGMSFFSSQDKKHNHGEQGGGGGSSHRGGSNLQEPLLEQYNLACKKLDEEAVSVIGDDNDTASIGSDSLSSIATSVDSGTLTNNTNAVVITNRPPSPRRKGKTANKALIRRRGVGSFVVHQQQGGVAAGGADQQNGAFVFPPTPVISGSIASSPPSLDPLYPGITLNEDSLLSATIPAPSTGSLCDSSTPSVTKASTTNSIKLLGYELTNFQAGILVAILGGVWGGSIMIPMKLCNENTSGLGYLVSFSSGATMVTLAFWIVRFLYNMGCSRSIYGAYKVLPSFHLKEMWAPGGLSGLVWSTGNLFGILAVHHLGAGVGYCVCQSSMLVGGMWGIFYFGEVKGRCMIAKWFVAALTTITGIALLAYEKGD